MGDTHWEWFKNRTFHHQQYADIGRLVELKDKSDYSISVCLPTLNVETTVGRILEVFRDELIQKHSLIDELAIIDSGSRDKTVEIARELGATVYDDREILPHLEQASGKGEALWKSLYALKGDIIVWIDSDIRNIHPRFVYGLVGPLLEDAEIGYVKGFYRRPIRVAQVVRPTGGGRVTELVSRPLINLYYPHLAGLIQPLSGEYAGRREVFDSVPFFTGYGVETCLNIDISEKFGMKSIAQVDLEVREHRNQPLDALSRMSFGILQAVFKHLAEDGIIELRQSPSTTYHAIMSEDGTFRIDPIVIEVIGRPSMRDILEYREEHNL